MHAKIESLEAVRKNTLFNCDLEEKFIKILVESILYNTDARIEMDD